MTGIELIADFRGAPAASVSEAIRAWAAEPHAVTAFARALFAIDDRALVSGGLPPDWEAVDGVVPGLLDGVVNVLRLVHKQLANPHRGPAPLDAIGPAQPAGTALGLPPAARFRS